MSTRAPFFLWADKGSHEGQESVALTKPELAEKQMHNRTFEEVVGTMFLEDAYRPELMLARELFHVLCDGIPSRSAIDLTETLLDEWEAMHSDV